MTLTNDQALFLREYLLAGHASETKATARTVAAVPEASLGYRPDPKSRTAGELAWHIVTSDAWFLQSILNGTFNWGGEQPVPAEMKSGADMAAWYERTVPPLVEKVRALPVEDLTKVVDFFGMVQMPNACYLSFMNNHTIHHRGQLAANLRAMGGKVPSIYGGSADEPMQ